MAQTQWTWTRFNTEIQKKNILPVYFFYGEEAFLLNEALVRLSNLIIDKKLRDFNLQTFYADSTSASQIIESVKTLPLMADKKMVILKGLNNFKEIDTIQSLIDPPITSCVLVFTDHKIGLRRKFLNAISKVGAIVKCAKLKDSQIVAWMRLIASRQQKLIDEKTCYFLLQRVGPSMLDLHNEVTKLIQHVKSKPSITTQDIQKIVSKTDMESIFDLVNALGSSQALLFLRSLFQQGQNEIAILAMLSRQIRILMLIKEAQTMKLSSSEISKRVSVSPYFLHQYIKQSQAWNFQQLKAFHTLLLETDYRLKGTSIPKALLIENCILKASYIKQI